MHNLCSGIVSLHPLPSLPLNLNYINDPGILFLDTLEVCAVLICYRSGCDAYCKYKIIFALLPTSLS